MKPINVIMSIFRQVEKWGRTRATGGVNYAELSCIVFTLAPTNIPGLPQSSTLPYFWIVHYYGTLFMTNSEGQKKNVEHDDDMNLTLSLVQIYLSRQMIV